LPWGCQHSTKDTNNSFAVVSSDSEKRGLKQTAEAIMTDIAHLTMIADTLNEIDYSI
jgi:hypothetical protein